MCEPCDIVYKRKVGGRHKRKKKNSKMYKGYYGTYKYIRAKIQMFNPDSFTTYDWMILCVEAVIT